MVSLDWKTTPCVVGRLATKDDVKSGRAAFYLQWRRVGCLPCELQLPKLAVIVDEATNLPKTVIVIQAEQAIGNSGLTNTILGYCTPKYDVCTIEEITWVDESSHSS